MAFIAVITGVVWNDIIMSIELYKWQIVKNLQASVHQILISDDVTNGSSWQTGTAVERFRKQ